MTVFCRAPESVRDRYREEIHWNCPVCGIDPNGSCNYEASADAKNETLFRQMDRRLKAMTPIARKRRLSKLLKKGRGPLTLSETLEVTCLHHNIDPWAGEKMVLDGLNSGEIRATGVMQMPKWDKGVH